MRLYLDYSALSYNCESFAVSCVTGQAATQQGKRAANAAQKRTPPPHPPLKYAKVSMFLF